MKYLFVFLVLFTPQLAGAQVTMHGRVGVNPNGHDLQYADGTPFFWLGDTGWELFHRLDREEISKYLENRRQKGFTVIQAVILAEFDGLRKPNRYGQVPLQGMDPEKPNEEYFELVDWTVQQAAEKNLCIAMLPTWGDKVTRLWGEGPVVFNEKNAYDYGLFLGKRYARSKNIIWMLGGDRPALKDSDDWRPVWRAMARGLREGSPEKVMITYHTWGGSNSTSQYLQQESWLDMNTMQGGHGGGHDVPVWEWIERDRNYKPVKPTLDAEPNYEDHPVNPWPTWDPANGYYRDYDVRKQCYRSVFAGACGVTYGHHAVWQFWSPREEKINFADRYWTEAIDRPGAFQVGYLRMLIESRSVTGRVPDNRIIASGQGEKGEYATAFRDGEGRYLMVYLPVGKPISVNTSHVRGNELTGWWFNPRDNTAQKIKSVQRGEKINFTPPATGPGEDWVLVVEDASVKFPQPGR